MDRAPDSRKRDIEGDMCCTPDGEVGSCSTISIHPGDHLKKITLLQFCLNKVDNYSFKNSYFRDISSKGFSEMVISRLSQTMTDVAHDALRCDPIANLQEICYLRSLMGGFIQALSFYCEEICILLEKNEISVILI